MTKIIRKDKQGLQVVVKPSRQLFELFPFSIHDFILSIKKKKILSQRCCFFPHLFYFKPYYWSFKHNETGTHWFWSQVDSENSCRLPLNYVPSLSSKLRSSCVLYSHDVIILVQQEADISNGQHSGHWTDFGATRGFPCRVSIIPF